MVFSVVYFMLYPFIIFELSRSSDRIFNAEAAGSPTSKPSDRSNKAKVRLGDLFGKPRFFFGIWAQMNLLMSLQFLAPNLAVHIKEYGFSTFTVGIAYGIPAMLFALTCPFIYMLTERMRKRGLILIGWMMITMALLMIGGTSWIKGFENPEFIFLGLVIIGLSAGMTTIPILPEMLEAIEDDQTLDEKYDREVIENTTSGLFITFQSIGETVGPILNSMLVKYYGFMRAFEIYSSYLMVWCLMYFLFCGNFSMIFGNPCSSADSI